MLNAIIKLAMMLTLISLIACSSKDKNIRSKQAGLYFGSGTQSLMAGDYTEALTALRKANELTPKNSEILTNLGMAYYFKGEKELAVRHLNLALEIDEKNPDARMNLASIYLENKDIDRAEKTYKVVLKDLTYDKQARTLYNLAIIENDYKKNVDAAEKYLVKALKEDGSYCPAHLKLGMIQFSRRKFNTALRSFKEAGMGTCYETAAPIFYQALAYAELNKFEDARIKFEEVVSRFPKNSFAQKSRQKIIELNSAENRYNSIEAQAPRKVLESPEF